MIDERKMMSFRSRVQEAIEVAEVVEEYKYAISKFEAYNLIKMTEESIMRAVIEGKKDFDLSNYEGVAFDLIRSWALRLGFTVVFKHGNYWLEL